MPTAQAQVSIDSGAAQSGGITVSNGAHTVKLTVGSLDGVTSTLWEIYSYPVAFSVPSGWSLNSTTGAIYSTATSPSTFSISASTWGKYMFRLTINGGLVNGQLSTQCIDATTAVSMPGAAGTVDIGFDESTQFSSSRAWVAALQQDLRILDASVATMTYNPEPTSAVHSSSFIISTPYTYKNILVDSHGGSITVTLPTSVSTGTLYRIIDAAGHAGSYPVAINSGGSDTINGGLLSFPLSTNYGKVTVIWSGTKWIAVAG